MSADLRDQFVHGGQQLGHRTQDSAQVELALTLAAFDQAGGMDGDRVEHCAVADLSAAKELAARGIRVPARPAVLPHRLLGPHVLGRTQAAADHLIAALQGALGGESGLRASGNWVQRCHAVQVDRPCPAPSVFAAQAGGREPMASQLVLTTTMSSRFVYRSGGTPRSADNGPARTWPVPTAAARTGERETDRASAPADRSLPVRLRFLGGSGAGGGPVPAGPPRGRPTSPRTCPHPHDGDCSF